MEHIRITVTDESGTVHDTLRTKEIRERNLNAEDVSERAAEMVYEVWEDLNGEDAEA